MKYIIIYSNMCKSLKVLKYFLIYILIAGKLLYNVGLVSALEQYESVIIIYIYTHIFIYIPSLLSLPLIFELDVGFPRSFLVCPKGEWAAGRCVIILIVYPSPRLWSQSGTTLIPVYLWVYMYNCAHIHIYWYIHVKLDLCIRIFFEQVLLLLKISESLSL